MCRCGVSPPRFFLVLYVYFQQKVGIAVRGHDRRNGARAYLRNFLSFANSGSPIMISIVTDIFINWSNLEHLKSQRQSYSSIFELSFLSFTCNFKYFFSAKNETHDEGLTQHNFKTSKKLRQFYEIAIHFVAE